MSPIAERKPHKPTERCVNCGYPRKMHTPHLEALTCRGSSGRAGKVFQNMNLPPGRTCADCMHTERCVSLFGAIPQDETCDFFPVRYMERGK